jgi:1-acyl-sn-glycerol-3-phosphate acyltransferase
MKVHMSLWGHFVTRSIRGILHLLCRIRLEDLDTLPEDGPCIVAVNHINFLDVPLVFTHLYPRQTSSLVKSETWDNFFLAKLADLWNGIPLDRNSTDFNALRSAEARLKEGHILIVAPEGTRSGHGRLQRGNPGIVLFALRHRIPVYPVVHYGEESFHSNIKRLKRTAVTLRAGRPFLVVPPEGRVNSEVRQAIADEMMDYLASLLPPAYRGYYSELRGGAYRYLHFPEAADG